MASLVLTPTFALYLALMLRHLLALYRDLRRRDRHAQCEHAFEALIYAGLALCAPLHDAGAA